MKNTICRLVPVHLILSALLLAVLAWAGQMSAPVAAAPIPDDFPRFVVPGQEREMALLRALYWLHYEAAGPLIPLWDEWTTKDHPDFAADRRSYFSPDADAGLMQSALPMGGKDGKMASSTEGVLPAIF
jgi:hypothetical protein